MARPHPDLIQALRDTVTRLQSGARYEWGHMGRCNCGHLVQTLTQLSDYEIVKVVDFQLNEWTEHARDYCEGTGHRVEDLFLTLEQVGFAHDDVARLEYLSDGRVLHRLQRPELRRNDVQDVTLYMSTLADLLEEDLRATPPAP